MSAVLGMLGTAIGWINAARAIAREGADTSLVWAGVGFTLYTVTFGVAIFIMAAFCWYILRHGSISLASRDLRTTSGADR